MAGRRPNTRGPPRGRGARVRGASAASEPLPAAENVAVECSRGYGSRRGRGDSEPTDADREALLMDISQCPQGQSLEVPLDPKRRCVWQPLDSEVAGPSWASLPPARSPPPTPPPMSPGSSYSVPSPAVPPRGTGALAASEPLPAAENVVVECIRGHGGRGGCSGRGNSEPTDADREALLMDISQCPRGQSLEASLDPKRRRRPNTCSPPRGTGALAASEPLPAAENVVVECIRGHGGRGGCSGRGNSEPTDADREALLMDISQCPRGQSLEASLDPKRRYAEDTTRPQQQHPTPPRGCRNLRDADIDFLVNYGSEPESCDSDDEDDFVGRFPRAPYQVGSRAETPLDEDDPEPAEPFVEVAADFGHPMSAGEGPEVDVPEVPKEETEKPWGLFDFDWRTFPQTPISPLLRRETFSEINVGPTTPSSDPYDIFIDIWDREIMEHIASETNRYAQQVTSQLIQSNRLSPTSRIAKWRDTGVSELYVLMAIIMAMGVVIKSRLEEYWDSTADIFCMPGFTEHMSIDRFLILTKYLHFNNNEDMCAENLTESEASLFKIQPVLSHLNKKFQDMYMPDQNIALDESLPMWQGWQKFSPGGPNKAARRGIETYEICEVRTGYIWRFSIHAASRTPLQHDNDPLAATTSSRVLQMIAGLEYRGHTLWMENYYNSPALSRRLKSIGFDCVGTLRTDRKFVPQVINSLTRDNMRQEQIAGLTSGDIDVMVWRGANRVAMTSTYHGTGVRRIQQFITPISIWDYNVVMGGVDKKDELLSGFPIERKHTRVWYKKLFRRLLNVSVLNACVISNHSSFLPHRDFRMKLINDILSRHSNPRPILTPPPAHNMLIHHLECYPMENHQRAGHRCVMCAKLVDTFCVGCRKPLCLSPCFVSFHTSL